MRMSQLKYSNEEIEEIEKIIGSDLVLLGSDATETNFKANSQSPSIIHISTHSFLFKNYPVVVLKDDELNDGYLEVGEVAGLDIQSDLVVLSSCKSGLGEQDDAEGILGMQKAFFDAGASNILLSHWDVSDKYTSIFMRIFYDYWSEGINIDEALRLTKVKFIKEVNPNPYYWAAFTLAGNANSRITKRDSNNFIIMSLIGALLLFSILLFKQRFINIYKKIRT
jgi:CHAT domain-containing protein